jgi:Trk K+ transport system NAD-binding subunit
MKSIGTQLIHFLQHRAGRRNVLLLTKFLLFFLVMITVYSVIFHILMEREGTQHTWMTGFYWTLTVMSTLGFGDITFHTDWGRLFSVIVLLSGMVFMLILLPFTFIEFFYSPWMKAQQAAQVPRELPKETNGHVVVTHLDPVSAALIKKLDEFGYPYVLLISDINEAMALMNEGYRVVIGDLDDPETYRRVHVEQAAMVASTSDDIVNTNVVFTVREMSEKVPIISVARTDAARDVLHLAGCNHVLRPGIMMGHFLARRIVGRDAVTHVIGSFGQLLIAEATAGGTPLVGKTLGDVHLRRTTGVSVVGLWERGRFDVARPETQISSGSVLVMAGSRAQLKKYDEMFFIHSVTDAPVVIVGGGRVGRETGLALQKRNIDYRIIERLPELIFDHDKYILGDAVDPKVLEQAGITQSPAAVITPHDDDITIYLTILCRKLRPDMQIISRATLDRNVSSLHRAGADIVMSYASMGANAIFNLLELGDIVMVAEGLNILRVDIPKTLIGKTISESAIRQETGLTVVALEINGEMTINPDPGIPLPADSDLVLIGTSESERKFLRQYVKA